jgi:HK97 family phage prohead protease
MDKKHKKSFLPFEKSETGDYKFSGWLARYGNKDRDGDIIEKGAFKQAIDNKKVYNLHYNHKTNTSGWVEDGDLKKELEMIIGTFQAFEKDEGVWIEAELFDDEEASQKVYKLLKKGSLSEMSIGFGVMDSKDYSFDKELNGYRFKKAIITEGSIVGVPANPLATIEQVKSIKEETFDKEESFARIMKKINKYGGNNGR